MNAKRAEVLVGSVLANDEHDTGSWHPERPARLPAFVAGIEAGELGDLGGDLVARQARRDELERVHDPRYLDAVEQFVAVGGGNLDPDTVASAGSWTTALWAAGTALAAVEALQRGEAAAAFVGLRPPGHHATADRAMGFCLINNVAVAAGALATAGERVLIFDWDVHHGNGTQDIFWNDPRVLYASFHQHPAYPGSGRAHETGGPEAPGLTLNVPLPPGATGDVALAAFDEVLLPAAEAFGPTWVLISAGYDAHRDDPLAELQWSSGDYADLTGRTMALAPEPGRVVALLEGGYDLDALSRSVAATVATLAGIERRPEAATSGGPGRAAVDAAVRIRAEHGGTPA